jgi:hypothetical protein
MKPLPNLDDSAAMARLGRLSALRSARAEVLHELRDTASKLLNGPGDDGPHIAAARALLDRLDLVCSLESKEYRR